MYQSEKVIKHINEHGSINSIEAISMYGITRLAAVIHNLRHTKDAMKGVEAPDLAHSFVRYVPDWEARFGLLEETFLNSLHQATTAEAKALCASNFAMQMAALEVNRLETPKPQLNMTKLSLVG